MRIRSLPLHRVEFHLAVFTGALLILFAGCGSREDKRHSEVVFVCTQTGGLIVGPNRETPAVNEQTGERTLVRALYCERCQKWYPSPTSQSFRGNPLQMPCPTTGGPLAATGPLDAKVHLVSPSDEE